MPISLALAGREAWSQALSSFQGYVGDVTQNRPEEIVVGFNVGREDTRGSAAVQIMYKILGMEKE